MLRDYGLTVVGFMAVSFAVQALSHFVINVDHYASVTFTRPDAIIVMGLVVMVIQALILAFVMRHLFANGASLGQAMGVAALFGVFLASYIILAEPAKYAVPSIPAWLGVETTASGLQFVLTGGVLWLIFRNGSA